MSRKRRNLMKIWEKEGYTVKRFNSQSYTSYYFTEVYFVKENGRPVSFMEDWDDIKTMLKRQRLYGLPITECDSQKYACVRVIDYSLITEVEWDCKRILEDLESNYWHLQKDEEVERCVDLLKRIKNKAENVRGLVRRSMSNTKYDYCLNTLIQLEEFWSLAWHYCDGYDLLHSLKHKMESELEIRKVESYKEYMKVYRN